MRFIILNCPDCNGEFAAFYEESDGSFIGECEECEEYFVARRKPKTDIFLVKRHKRS